MKEFLEKFLKFLEIKHCENEKLKIKIFCLKEATFKKS